MKMPLRAAVLALLSLSAGSGALAQDAADAYYNPAAMEQSREALRHEAGGQVNYFLQANRYEFQTKEGAQQGFWEARGWVGGDYQKFWFKTEGAYVGGGAKTDEAEIQGLYSRAISPFFDFQAGVRQDFSPGARRTFGVVGIQGLAPYWFELDAALFFSHEGDVSARIEAEYEFRFTQRLILQPRGEVNLAVQSVRELGIGSGLSNFETGARLRYEIRREVAPYVGVSWVRATGRTADFARADGRDPSSVSLVAGLRLWF